MPSWLRSSAAIAELLLIATTASCFILAKGSNRGSPVNEGGREDVSLLAEEENAALWERLLRGPSPLGDASVEEGGGAADSIGELLARAAKEAEAQQQEDGRQLRFPELTDEQAKFAVNPGYKEFYEEEYRPGERLGGKEEVSGGELESGGEGEEPAQHKFPKKAALQGRASSYLARDAIEQEKLDDIYFTTILAVSSALAVFAIVGAGFCYHRVRRNSKASEDVDYPAYGVTGPGGGKGKDGGSPTGGASGDRKLAQNAQLYHYQHQKQQMIAFDTSGGAASEGRALNGAGANGASGANGSDCESDEEGEGDYTVYECPGLAPAGEMEVHNPLFQGDTTPKASK